MDIKKIKKCNDILEKAWVAVAKTPSKVKTLNWHGVEFEVWKTGMCFWTGIWFLIEDKKVYGLERSDLIGPSGDNFRNEYFKEKLKRTYDGEQNCFIEFCEFLARLKGFPNSKEFKLAGTALELEGDIVALYTRKYKKIFGKVKGKK